MKKEKIKELLFWGLIIIIGVACIYVVSLRAEQINNQEEIQNV